MCGRRVAHLAGAVARWVAELQLVGDTNIYWSSSSSRTAAAAAAALSCAGVDHEHKRPSAVDMATATWVGSFSIEHRPLQIQFICQQQ